MAFKASSRLPARRKEFTAAVPKGARVRAWLWVGHAAHGRTTGDGVGVFAR